MKQTGEEKCMTNTCVAFFLISTMVSWLQIFQSIYRYCESELKKFIQNFHLINLKKMNV